MIQVEHLTKRYAGHTALTDLSFSVEKGRIAGFLGPTIVIWGRQILYKYFPDQMSGLPPVIQSITPKIVEASIHISFGIALVVGTIFVVYPAIRAAKMDPIEALRHE